MNKKISIIVIIILLLTFSISTINVLANNTGLEVYVENVIEENLVSASSTKNEETYQILINIDNEILANIYDKKDWSKLEELVNEDGYVYNPIYIKVPNGAKNVKAVIDVNNSSLEITEKENELYAEYDMPIFKKEGSEYVPLVELKNDLGQSISISLNIIATDISGNEVMNEDITMTTKFKLLQELKVGVLVGSKESILGGVGDYLWQKSVLNSNENYIGCHLKILTSKKLKNDYINVSGIGKFVYEGYNSDNEFQTEKYTYTYEIKDNRLNANIGTKRYYIVAEDTEGNKELYLLDIAVSGGQQTIQEESRLSNTISNNIISFKEQYKDSNYLGEITIDKSLLNDDVTWEYFEDNEKLEEKLYVKLTSVYPIYEEQCFYKIKNEKGISELHQLHILKDNEEGYVEGEVWAVIPITLLQKENYQIKYVDNIENVNEILMYLNTEKELIDDNNFNQSYNFKIITKNEVIVKPNQLVASDFTKTSLGYKSDITINYGNQLETPKVLYICNLKSGGQSYFVTDVLKGKTAKTQLVIDNSKIESIEVWLVDGEIDFAGDAFSGVKADVLELSITQ